ncbi:MAG: NADH:flavin oxidoreductase, Old Yellow Enzyme family [Oscillospiraceae bacterium]|nr:NADH:flavin oxidoreductase, Old Yellow Enzyme family [Oscillospiraceae bacterium]
MEQQYPHIFSPITIGGVTFKNRVWSAPAGTHLLFGKEEYPSEAAIAYYRNKAAGGTACVTYSSQNMDVLRPDDWFHAQDNIFKPETHRFYRRLTDAIHFYGAKASIECLNFSFHDYDEKGILQNYSVNGDTNPETGEESVPFTRASLEKLASLYADAAEAAVACCFDVILIHGGHGLILSQFLSPLFNQRTDEFGGSFENRCRFPLMVLEAIRSRVGKKLLIEYRISGSELAGDDGFTVEDCIAFLKTTQKKYIDIAHISAGSTFSETEHIMHPTNFIESGCNVYLAEAVKKCPDIQIPVLTLGGLQEPEQIEEILASGKADLVAMARGTICDAHLVEKARHGRGDEIIPCIKCFYCLDYARNTAFGCSANPEVGREYCLKDMIPPVGEIKNVLVIGGGPSGMQAAITARQRGHSVTLLEKAGQLGGKLVFSRQVSFKHDLCRFMDYQIHMMEQLGVDVLLNTEATPSLISTLNPDVIIAALGADAAIPPIPGVHNSNVITAEECYHKAEQGEALGETIVVLGGGLVGCETALYLAMALGKQVTVVEMLDTLASEEFWLPQWAMMEKMDEFVTYHTSSCCTKITETGLTFVDGEGMEHTVAADTVVLAAGMRPRTAQAEAFRPLAFDFAATGDCVKAQNVRTATRSAFDAAVRI